MKNFWYSIKSIIYTYIIQYIFLILILLTCITTDNDISILMDVEKIYELTIIGTIITVIPLSIYLYKKYKIKESKIELKKLLPMIPLGLSVSLFYNMLTIKYQTSNTLGNLNIILLVLYVVIIAPIFEELLFRYVSLRHTRERYQDKTAIIIISIVFALMHSGIINIIYAFLLGIVLSYIYVKYKNIIYPIVLHISANLMSIFISKFNLIALIISIIVLILTTIYIKKTYHI